jgi:AcrR family transcriptional regulator
MARWAPGTAERLRNAALELFEEKGFAATTVPDIVSRAGLTQRTFFRHFSDKREVFFGDDEIPALAARMIEDAPTGAEPRRIVTTGLRALAASRFEPRRPEMRAARQIIEAEPALRERDLRKQADLREAIRAGFVHRGVDPLHARVIAGFAVELIQISLEAWLTDPAEASLVSHLDAVQESLEQVFGAPNGRHG